MRELKNIEERILDRTLYLIGINHSCNISVRAIAREAKVNVSAINYYFRSKEEMLNQAKELFIANSTSITDILSSTDLQEDEKLVLASSEIMEYNLRFPGITVLLRDAAEKDDEISKRIIEVSDRISNSVNYILDRILMGEKSEVNFQSMIYWSAINYPLENNRFIQCDMAVLKDKESKMSYIRYLLDLLRN